MQPKPINLRFTVIAVFAFLLIVGLFMQPGGTAEQASEKLVEVAREASGKAAAKPAAAGPRSWFAPDSEEPVIVRPTPANNPGQAGPPAMAAGNDEAGIPAPPSPSPQGPDFPNANR